MYSAQDIKSAQKHLRTADPIMKRLLKKVGPFTLKVNRDRFQMLVFSIISQQISTSAAKTIRQRLIDHVAPDSIAPESLQGYTLESFREIGVSKQKATYILDLTERALANDLRLKQIGRLDDEAAIEHLIQVKGIGRWTAQMFLIFSLGRLNVMAVDDLGLKNAAKKAYDLNELPDSTTFLELAEPWQPYRSVASWYLWQSLELNN